jgi:hypothetical protein
MSRRVRDNRQDYAGPTRFLRVSNDRDKLLVGGKLVWRVRTWSGEPTRNRTPLLPVAPVIAKHRERAGRVKGAQRRSGPLTRLSAPGQSGTGATANQEAITPGKLGATLAGTGAEAKQFWLFLPEGKLALTSVRILGQHSGARTTRAPQQIRH